MVNQFVQAHGIITRAEAAELCHLPESQAFCLLKGMSEGGLLKRVGNGRDTYYERVEKNARMRQINACDRNTHPLIAFLRATCDKRALDFLSEST